MYDVPCSIADFVPQIMNSLIGSPEKGDPAGLTIVSYQGPPLSLISICLDSDAIVQRIGGFDVNSEL